VADKLSVEDDLVKKSTMYISIIIAVVVGFLGGIIFSSLQSGANMPIAQSTAKVPEQGNSQQMRPLTSEQAGKIMALSQHLTTNPKDAAAWIQLGNIYFDTNQPSKAITAYSKSLELRPGNASVLTDLGVMYRRDGKPDQAIESFDQAIAADPQNVQAMFNKGIVMMYDKGDTSGAIQIWEKLVKLNPGAKAANGKSVAEIIEEARKSMGGGR